MCIRDSYTTETPCLENLDMAAGYDVVDVITTVFDKPMLKKLHDLGIKCIATRTIGYDHIDVEYAKAVSYTHLKCRHTVTGCYHSCVDG